jgi:hypothetical protein
VVKGKGHTLLDEFKGVTKWEVTPSQPGEIITNLT